MQIFVSSRKRASITAPCAFAGYLSSVLEASSPPATPPADQTLAPWSLGVPAARSHPHAARFPLPCSSLADTSLITMEDLRLSNSLVEIARELLARRSTGCVLDVYTFGRVEDGDGEGVQVGEQPGGAAAEGVPWEVLDFSHSLMGRVAGFYGTALHLPAILG